MSVQFNSFTGILVRQNNAIDINGVYSADILAPNLPEDIKNKIPAIDITIPWKTITDDYEDRAPNEECVLQFYLHEDNTELCTALKQALVSSANTEKEQRELFNAIAIKTSNNGTPEQSFGITGSPELIEQATILLASRNFTQNLEQELSV